MSIMHDRRMDQVRENMKALGLSAMIVSETAALWYLTGESIHPGERLTVLVLQAKGPAFWIRNRLFPLKSGTGWTMAEAKAAGYIADISFEDGDDGMALLAKQLPEGKVGVDKVWPSSFLLDLMSRRKDLKFVNGSPAVDDARAVKDEREICFMRLASNINDRAMKKISQWITPGVTEKECAEKLLTIYKEEGAEGFSFPPIVSFGAHGADPHHMPDETPLKRRETVLFDIGCKKDNYCSDMTRTFFYGRPDAEWMKIHDLVREAGELAESMVRPGVKLSDLDKAARDHISKGGYGPCFTHRLGHFIGIREHEAGEVSLTSEIIAKPGMIFSIEPGVYLPGKFGIRIEDLVLVTEKGCEILNKADRGWNISL